MDKQLSEKEKQLERARIDNDIATQRAEIAQKKAVEAEMKKKYGTNWRKILGVGKMGLQDYYALDSSLKDLAIPRHIK